jgi:hypothetical protein
MQGGVQIITAKLHANTIAQAITQRNFASITRTILSFTTASTEGFAEVDRHKEVDTAFQANIGAGYGLRMRRKRQGKAGGSGKG